ncbi:LysR substrate-binding domain-containing protein [Falsiroseomonas sp. E2-1-a4]|uniref:LysR substrate-binding domain-containing protein n=1 Tax=Falsiroseomonas sp. E2-1-a4 TaxID=3239299 RepID=UPI003F2D9DB0
MKLSFRQLEVIRAVALHGSVTAAAGDLGVSQPAVSMMLRDCASTAGFALFQRSIGRLQPTQELRIFLDEVDRLFKGLERIDRLVGEIREASTGSVLVAATPTLADNLLPSAVAAFRRARPRIQITVQTMDNLSAVEAVTQGGVDFGLVLTPIAETDARLVPLCAGDLVCVVAADHPLAGAGTVTPRDLAPFPLISFSRSLPLGRQVEQNFREAGIARRIALEVNQSSTALALVRAGAGVAVIDPFLLLDTRDHGVVQLRLEPRATVTAQALVPGRGTLSRPALMLLAAIRRQGSAMPGVISQVGRSGTNPVDVLLARPRAAPGSST